MNPLLEQFLSESRETLQSAGSKLMQLENEPKNVEAMTELFRLVHTLKGNSGLFDFPEMTRVLHAAEDLMDAVRGGKVPYSMSLADQLLDAMDFIDILCTEIETGGKIDLSHAGESVQLAEKLRHMIGQRDKADSREKEVCQPAVQGCQSPPVNTPEDDFTEHLAPIPEPVRMAAFRSAMQGKPLYWLTYAPSEGCFFQGDDPFYQARHTPGLVWSGITHREPWPKLTTFDAYRCMLDFHILSDASLPELQDVYRYLLDQVQIVPVPHFSLIFFQGDPNGGLVYDDFISDAILFLAQGDRQQLQRNTQSMLELSNPDLWLSSALRWLRVLLDFPETESAVIEAMISSLRSLTPPDFQNRRTATMPEHPDETQTAMPSTQEKGDFDSLPSEIRDALAVLVAAQAEVLSLPDETPFPVGRIRGGAAALSGCLQASGRADLLAELSTVTEKAISTGSTTLLRSWLNDTFRQLLTIPYPRKDTTPVEQHDSVKHQDVTPAQQLSNMPASEEGDIPFRRRAEDTIIGAKTLKVDQVKIDRLMNLIGEMVVAKNALPYLAGRAESVFGVRDLSRDIKAEYAVINRIAEEMQYSIMQVRMMPVSFIFQRFPRLVRDISHRLGKEVKLVLEGEETEADKNIIEAIGDPLIHIVRNSLDHGIELPAVRSAAGKPAAGTLTIRARQESDRVTIEIIDDGKGIDPEAIKQKALEKGMIDEEQMMGITEQEAVNLVFAAGFSTAEEVSDLSGRGVGMDVVRSTVEKINGTLSLESKINKGTRLCLSLPLSMAVTNVMIVESDNQIFGVPIDAVIETVRMPRKDIRTIKNCWTTVLRGRIIPLKALNTLLGLSRPQKANDEDELAVLVVSHRGEAVGILVDHFRETVDIILKPMTGVLSGLAAYSGSALLGDGSVLMILNIKEIL